MVNDLGQSVFPDLRLDLFGVSVSARPFGNTAEEANDHTI